MKKSLLYGALVAVLAFIGACEKPEQPQQPVDPDPQPKPDQGFVEAVPDTVTFTNADFIYYGDITGESFADDWVVKLYTDMEIDDFGNPIGPGTVTQLQLNAKFDENQSADPSKLKGLYHEMMNSGNFAPGTFVSGYMVRLDLPGQTIEMGDGTFYADLVFLIGYIDPNIVKESDKKSNWNRFFLDEEDGHNWNITSWAMSESCFKMHVDNGDFDAAVMNDGVTVGERKSLIKPQPYTMNQFFEMPGLSGNQRFLQVRSSGYAKWADVNIPEAVRNGEATITFTGVLTKFENDRQFTLIDLSGVKKADGSPWYDANNKEIK